MVARAVHATYDSLKTALLIEQSQFLGVDTEGNALLIDYSETPVIHKEYGHDGNIACVKMKSHSRYVRVTIVIKRDQKS